MYLTPVAVFLYNRPDHARQLLDSLLNCTRLEECDVYLFCDGVKKPEHAAGVRAARAVAREFASRLKAKVIEREQNLGLARSSVSGVTELFQQHGRVVVLEDDFILHPFFLDFMLQSLDRYVDDERVAQVAGFTFPIKTPEKSDSFFLPLISSWGWATWHRAWKLFSWDMRAALEMLDANPQLRARFSLDDTYPFADIMRLAAEGQVDSWAIRWYWQTFSAHKLTLYPRRSLVWQNGFDETATNTKGAWHGMQAPLNRFIQKRWEHSISFPSSVQVDEIAFESLKTFYRRGSSGRPLARLKRMLKRVLVWLVK